MKFRVMMVLLVASFLFLGAISLAGAIVNQPPVADANGPYFGVVGDTVTLDGSGSYDPDGFIVAWEWDLDGDGGFDDASGEMILHAFMSAGARVVGLRVTDEFGEVDTTSAEVVIAEPGYITAHKYQDDNMNGVQDAGEPDIEGWLIELHSSENNGSTWMKIAEGYTDLGGTVVFIELDPFDLYKVVEETPISWINTTAASVIVTVQPDEGLLVEFGNTNIPPEHDVEAFSQTVTANEVMPGDLVDIDVSVRNNGAFTETFNLTCYYDSVELGTILVIDLAPAESRVATFTWDTTGVPLNGYLIKAWADSGEVIIEFDESNNWCTMPLQIFVVPEIPFGTILAFLSMFIALIGYVGFKRVRPKLRLE